MDNKFKKLHSQFTNLEATYKELKDKQETKVHFLYRLTATQDLASQDFTNKFLVLKSKIERLYAHTKNTPHIALEEVLASVNAIEEILANNNGTKFSLDKSTLSLLEQNMDLAVEQAQVELGKQVTTVRKMDYTQLTNFALSHSLQPPKALAEYTALYATCVQDLIKFKLFVKDTNKKVSDAIRDFSISQQFKFPMTYVFAKKNRTRFTYDNKTGRIADYPFHTLEGDGGFSFCHTTSLIKNPYTNQEEECYVILI